MRTLFGRSGKTISSELLDRVERGGRRAFVAWHTLSSLYYLVTPARGDADTRDFIAELIRFVAVAPADTAALRYALSLPMADFEDAMQVAAARACGARHIVTRNVRDFARSPIPATTPREALASFF
ncbi:MAG: PIN domain-containing protein [Acidobacteria bacterium]|nr:PIN domain-containing protein [Acidobacteriota bacterium]